MKTIFFDWGGVVADDPGDDFLTKLLQGVGATEEQIQQIYQKYMKSFMKGELSEEQYWVNLRNDYGLLIPDSISEEFKTWNGLVANQEILDLVDEAKEKGWKVAILSNVIEPTYNALLSAGLYDKFDVVIASCKVGLAKPDEKIYTLALEMLQTTASESVFIDDKQRNLDPAIEMGFRTIRADSPEQTARDIAQLIRS